MLPYVFGKDALNIAEDKVDDISFNLWQMS